MAKQHVTVEVYRKYDDLGVIVPRWSVVSDVYTRNPISISHGRGPEQGDPAPSTATLTIKGHDYNPENPASPYYGWIGRNTPVRIQAGEQPALTDAFVRSTSNGWGGTGALSWVTSPSDDHSVNGTAGVQTHPAAGVFHSAHVDTGSPDHRVRAVWELSAFDVTGGSVAINVRGRVTDGSNYYALNAEYSTDELVSISLVKRVAGTGSVMATATATIDLFGTATNDLIGELYIEGNRIYGSVWQRFFEDEPLTWQVSAVDDDLTTGDLVGFASLRGAGNTNANLEARLHQIDITPGTLRFAGEIASYRPRRSMGGDRWVEIEAADPLRRLQAPQADSLRSALWREILLNDPVAFWPLTDGVDVTSAASALPGGSPAAILTDGVLELRAINDWVEPILTPPTDEFVTYIGAVNQDPGDTEWTADLVFAVDTDAEDADLTFGLRGPPTNLAGVSTVEWILEIEAIGTDDFLTWSILVRSSDGTTAPTVSIAGGAVSAKDGRLYHVRLITSNNGSSTDWELLFNNATTDSGTTSEPWLPVQSIRLDYGTETAGQMTAGFPVVWDTAFPPVAAANAAVVGRSGELAGARLLRLLTEEGIGFEAIGDADDTEAMGPQLIDTLAANLAACESVDMGLLHGTRHQVGLTYRTRTSLYRQTPVTLDVAAGGEVTDPLEPDIGDLGVVNDVTVKRRNGGSARSEQKTGPLNVRASHLDPDGVGRYATDLEVNADLDSQLPNLADWRRSRGTIKAVRYPKVTALFGALRRDGKTALAHSLNRLRIGDRVDLDNAEPTGVMQLVPGYEEVIGPTVAERRITLHGTPAQLYDVGVYDDTGTRYDSRYSTTAAQITTGTDTSLSVAVEAGRSLWSTSAAPFDIDLAGARVRVTAVSGAASPQTFTISTTVVNGINKVIPADTPVRLWSPKRYGL